MVADARSKGKRLSAENHCSAFLEGNRVPEERLYKPWIITFLRRQEARTKVTGRQRRFESHRLGVQIYTNLTLTACKGRKNKVTEVLNLSPPRPCSREGRYAPPLPIRSAKEQKSRDDATRRRWRRLIESVEVVETKTNRQGGDERQKAPSVPLKRWLTAEVFKVKLLSCNSVHLQSTFSYLKNSFIGEKIPHRIYERDLSNNFFGPFYRRTSPQKQGII